MLPIYEAIEFVRILEKGGHTRPWVVLVDENGSLVQYVVEMFSAGYLQERDAVTNEVLGNVLAAEFGLNVPKAALIYFNDYFEMTFDNPQIEEIFQYTDDRIRFGTRLLAPIYEYKKGAFSSQEIKNYASIDSVFAFDILIRNGDRTDTRPNFFIHKKEGYILDHELGFNITEDSAQGTYRGDFSFKYHIFYKYLCSTWENNKKEFFDEFCEYLRLLNVNNLTPYFNQLKAYGYSDKRHLTIRNYLLEMKSNSANFGNILRQITR